MTSRTQQTRETQHGPIVFSTGILNRYDVSFETAFPRVSRRRLALQIRQDMWRRLQKLRGFSPVIEITEVEGGLLVKAGGQVDGKFPKAHVEAQIADLLEDPKYRARWIKFASRSSHPSGTPGIRDGEARPPGYKEQEPNHA